MVMAACLAGGEYLPTIVIFQGQHVQSSWYPWIYCNESGWMDSETFYKWFEEFAKKKSVERSAFNL